MPRLLRGILGLVLLAGTASPLAADLQQIRKRGTLRVLVMLDTRRPEFFSLKPGTPPGFDRELLEGFAKLHRLKLEPVPASAWDTLIPSLVERKGDLIAGRFTATPARRKIVEFTSEVFPTRNVIITRRPHKGVTSVEELRTERVGTIRGTSMAEAIAEAGVPPGNVDDGLAPGSFGEALESGRVTAAVWGVESAIALQREDGRIQLGAFLGPPASLAWAVRKDEPQLLKALNEYVENTRKTPTWSRLVVKYFGESAPEILKKARPE